MVDNRYAKGEIIVSVSPRSAIAQLNTYVPGKPIEEVKRELGLSDVIKLASNENPLGPSPRALEALQRAAAEVHLYPDSHSADLRAALAAHYNVAAEQVVVGNGSDEVIRLLAECYLEPGDEIVVARPTFSVYAHAARLMGAKVIEVPFYNQEMDLRGMIAATTSRTKMIFICNPNNPTGTMVEAKDMFAFFERVPPGVLVVVDEAYAEYVDHPMYPRSMAWVAMGKDVVVLRTFSKIYGLAGLRIGYGIGRADLIAPLLAARDPFSVNRLAQAAGVAALQDGAFVQRSRGLNAEGKKYLYGELQRLQIAYLETQSNFILMNVGRPGKQVFEAMLRRGVIVRPGDSFGLKTHIRITVGTMEQNRRCALALEEALREVPEVSA